MVALHHALLLGTFLCVLIIACCLVEVEGSYRSWNRKDGDKNTYYNTATKTISHNNGKHNINHGKHNYNNGRYNYNNAQHKKLNCDVTTYVQRKIPKKSSTKKNSNIMNKIRSSRMDFTRISKSHSKRLQYELVVMAATKKKLECKIKTLNRKLDECKKHEMNPNTVGKLHFEKEEMRSQLGRAMNRLLYLEQECGRVKHKMDLDILVLEAQINVLLSNNTALESQLEVMKANCSQSLISPQADFNVSTDPKDLEAFCNATCPCKENEYCKNAKMECFADVESCGLTWDLQNIGGKYFYISKGEKTWHQAREYCRSCSMELAVFEDRNDELDMMDDMVTKLSLDMSSSQFWIGLSDLSVNGIFSNNYRKPDYSNWAPGLPNNANTEEHCVYVKYMLSNNQLQEDLKWYHDNCNEKKQFICQLSKHCTPYFDELRGNPVHDYSDIIPDFITAEEEKNQNKLQKFKTEATAPDFAVNNTTTEYPTERADTDSTPSFVTQTTTFKEEDFQVSQNYQKETTSFKVEDFIAEQVTPETTTVKDIAIPQVPPETTSLWDQDYNTDPPGPKNPPEMSTGKVDDFVLPQVDPNIVAGQDSTLPPAPQQTTKFEVNDFTFPNNPPETATLGIEDFPNPFP